MIRSSTKHFICLLTGASLSACVSSSVEKEILQSTAINDAQRAPKALHLAYLNCYALPDIDKKICQDKASQTHKRRTDATSWDYIHPFDYEAERQGFATFLRDRGKSCLKIDEGPQYDKAEEAYQINCSNGERYLMRFNQKSHQWKIGEKA
jgi:hypothetical protein